MYKFSKVVESDKITKKLDHKSRKMGSGYYI